MFHSLRTRLTLSHLAAIVAAMGLSGFLLLSLLERYFLQAMEESLMAQAEITARALFPGAVPSAPSASTPPSAFNAVQQQAGNLALQAQNVTAAGSTLSAAIDLEHLSNVTLQLSSQLETRIRILDRQGVVLLDSQQPGQSAELRTDPLVSRALAGQIASGTTKSEAAASMSLAMPLQSSEGVVGVVLLTQPLKDVSAVLLDLRLRWLLSSVVALVLAGVAGLLLSGAIARPIRRLTEAVGSIGEGRLEQEVPVASRDELGRLSQAFNQMAQRLAAARDAQNEFVANVSHELRTPLTAVKGLLETLRDGAVDDPEVRDKFLETAESETDRLIRLVNDLLVLSRADAGALGLKCQPMELEALARAMAERLRPCADKARVTVQVEAEPDLPSACADPDRVGQVLINLLDNAVKHSRPGGEVAIRLSTGAPGQVQVQVCDCGDGIPAEALPHLGVRFYRVDRARSRAEGGTGLGLAIARALVEAHGGQLKLESQAGVGTTVTFTLPAST